MSRLRMGHRLRTEQGFSVLEVLIVVAIGATVMGIALFGINTARNAFQTNGSMELLKSRLMVAREMAVAKQRDIQITFVNPFTVRFSIVNPNATLTQVDEVILNSNTTFMTFANQGAPGDQWCTDAQNAFRVLNGQANLRFNSDGALINSVDRSIVSGCFYLGRNGLPESARAISLFGATGRARTYKYMSAAWVH